MEATGAEREAAELYLRAVDMPSDVCQAFLGRVCLGNDGLRLGIEGLLDQTREAQREPSTNVSTANVVAIADVLCTFLDAASTGDPPELARFAPDPAETIHERTLTELIKLDQKLRWSLRQPKPLELYLREWPMLRNRPALVVELLRSECLSRATFAASATAAELQLRFQHVASHVSLDDIEKKARPIVATLTAGGMSTGSPLPERFSIVRKVGEGGMGVVYEAVDRHRGTHVALKTLPKMEPLALYRFKREFRTLAGLVHPALVCLYELISDGSIWFFTMELVRGVDFISYIRQRHLSVDAHYPSTSAITVADVPQDTTRTTSARLQGYTLDFDVLRAGLRQLTEGVLHLHSQRILHRDLKPSNVLVREDGRVVILDFGLAKAVAATDSDADSSTDPAPRKVAGNLTAWTKHHDIVGSVPYMSPEQAVGLVLTEATDWYSVGVMLYEALTGRLPFSGNSEHILRQKQRQDPIPPQQHVSDVPDDLNALCVALLRRDPRQRADGMDVLGFLTPSQHRAQRQVAFARPAEFVGREKELELLSAAYRELEHNRAVTVHIRGRSGSGKTALAQRFIGGLPANAIALSGRCYEQESVPYKALDSIVDDLCGRLIALPRAEVESLIPVDIAALARIFPVLGRVEAVQQACRGRPEIPNVHELRRRGFVALGEMLQRVGRVAPLVLFIDDLQWGDVDSAALLISLLDAVEPPRLLLVASYRSEYADTNPCLMALNAARHRQVCFDVDVAPLPFDESRQLAMLLLQGRPASAETPAWIARESGGNPYFVYELARQVALAGERDPAAAPRSLDLDEALWSRVQGLPVAARHLLEVIAVAGKPLLLRSACEAAGLGDQLSTSVATLRVDHLVRSSGPGLDDEIETYHDRIRESVGAHVSAAARTEHHRRLAFVLEAARSTDIEATASHFHRAGMFAKAGEHYAAAADKAAAALAFERSAELYGLALEVGQSSVADVRLLRRKRAQALGNAGRGYEAGGEYQRAAAGADANAVVDLQCKAGYQYCVSGHIDEGREAFAIVLAHFGKRLPRTRRQALLSLIARRLQLRLRGMHFRPVREADVPPQELERVDIFWSLAAAMTIADPIRGADFQTHDLILALRVGEPYRIARALAWEAAHISMGGIRLKRRAQAQLAAADRLASEINVPHATGMISMSRGVAAYFHGDFAECLRNCEAAAQIFRERCTGVSWELETCNAFAFWPFYFAGQYAELARRFSVLISEVRSRGARLAEADLTNFGGPFVWLAADDPDGARRAVSGVMGEWSRQDFQVQHFMTLTAESQIDLYAGDGRAAWQRVTTQWTGLADAMLLQVEIVRIYMLHLRARCALAALRMSGDRERLCRAAERDARRLARERPPYAKALASTIRAALFFERGDTASASAVLGTAADDLDALGWGCFGSAARRRRGELLGGEAGQRIVRAVDQELAAQGVKRPDILCSVNAPGFTRE
jgi:hypothetical protein